MFKLHKHKSAKSVDKIEYRISNLKALQVPKGWDKLFVSVVSVENGKTIAKSSKVAVRNGSCQWSDTISESISVSRDNSSKEIDDCLIKLIVAMGSLRSGILGEATISMSSYVNSDAAVPLSISLNKCNHGTILNVTVQCLTPKKKPRDQESRETNSHLKAMNENNHEVTVKSNVQSVESNSVGDVDPTLSTGEVETMATSISGSISNCSYNSAEDSIGRGNISPCISDGQSPMGRQGSTSSQKSVSHYDYPVNNSSQSNRSSFNSQNMQDIGASPSKMTNGSNNSLEASEESSVELRAEAKMWEMNARKLLGDLEMLRTEYSDQSKKLEGLETNLSTAYVERDSLKKEVEQLTLSSGDPIVRRKTSEDSISQGECIPEIENDLKVELKFQKESNANLSLQLKKSQEANVELVSVLHELEETIERQKLEMENLSSLPSKVSTLEKSLQLSEEGNRIFMQQIEQLEESKKNLLAKVQKLEEVLEDKMQDIEYAKIPNNKTLSDIEMEYESKLSAKEEEISRLKARLPETCNVEIASKNVGDADLLEQMEELKEKVQALEMDCNELTNENLELLFKLKEVKTNSNMLKDQSFSSVKSEPSNNLFRIFHSEDILPEENGNKISNDDHISKGKMHEMKHNKSDIEHENGRLLMQVSVLEAQVRDLTNELESQLSELENARTKASRLEEKVMKIQSEMDSSIEDLEQKLKAAQFHWSEVQEECEYLRGENQQLQITIENLEEECSSFEKLNGYLSQKTLELEEFFSLMGARLRESGETLRADKSKLESAFGELYKTEVNMVQIEYEQNLKDLTNELAYFKIKIEKLMAEHENLSELVDDYKSRELKFESTINSLESKITVTEFERQQYMNESGNLKVQLQQTSQFENEIMALKNELNASNTEKERLKASLCFKSDLCDDLKVENTSFEQKSSLEKAASELEHCNRTRASLEERLMQLENELNARDARYVQEKTDLMKKSQALEEELKLIKEQKRNHVSKLNRKPHNDDQKASKNNSTVKNTNQVRSNKRRPPLKNDREIPKDQQDPYYSRKHQTEVESEHGLLDEDVRVVEVVPVSKTHFLETEVENEKEANDIYEVQLNRSSPQGGNSQENSPVKPMAEEELVTKEKFESTKSKLEAELTDIQDRYFHMSLKYAEVEAEREELVMKLKMAKTKKGWFS